MRKSAWGLLGVVALAPVCAGAADFELKMGQLTHSGSYATQVVAVTNRTGSSIQMLKVECGFFRGDGLLAAGAGFAQNVSVDQTAYVDVLAEGAGNSDRADCRVSFVGGE